MFFFFAAVVLMASDAQTLDPLLETLAGFDLLLTLDKLRFYRTI